MYIRSETQARVIVIEANPGNELVECFNPGSRARLDCYNAILRQAAFRQGAEILALDVLTQRDPGHRPARDWIPDGTQFNAEGHRLLAGALADPILASRPPNTATSAKGGQSRSASAAGSPEKAHSRLDCER